MDERTAVVRAQERLDEPVLGAVLVNRCGVMDAVLSSAAADVATGGWAAVACPRIRSSRPRLRVKQELATFDRAGLQGAARQGSVTTVFHLKEPGRRSGLSFEIVASDYARDFAAVLGVPVEGADPNAPRGRDRRTFWRWFHRAFLTLLVLAFVGAFAAYTTWYFFYGQGPAQ